MSTMSWVFSWDWLNEHLLDDPCTDGSGLASANDIHHCVFMLLEVMS